MGYNPAYSDDLSHDLATILGQFVTPSPAVLDKADILIEKSNPRFQGNWATDGTIVKFGFDRQDWSHIIRGVTHPRTGKIWLLELNSHGSLNKKGFDMYRLESVLVVQDEDQAHDICRIIRAIVRMQREQWAEDQLASLDDNEHMLASDVYGDTKDAEAEDALDEMEALMGASQEADVLAAGGFHIE